MKHLNWLCFCSIFNLVRFFRHLWHAARLIMLLKYLLLPFCRFLMYAAYLQFVSGCAAGLSFARRVVSVVLPSRPLVVLVAIRKQKRLKSSTWWDLVLSCTSGPVTRTCMWPILWQSQQFLNPPIDGSWQLTCIEAFERQTLAKLSFQHHHKTSQLCWGDICSLRAAD